MFQVCRWLFASAVCKCRQSFDLSPSKFSCWPCSGLFCRLVCVTLPRWHAYCQATPLWNIAHRRVHVFLPRAPEQNSASILPNAPGLKIFHRILLVYCQAPQPSTIPHRSRQVCCHALPLMKLQHRIGQPYCQALRLLKLLHRSPQVHWQALRLLKINQARAQQGGFLTLRVAQRSVWRCFAWSCFALLCVALLCLAWLGFAWLRYNVDLHRRILLFVLGFASLCCACRCCAWFRFAWFCRALCLALLRFALSCMTSLGFATRSGYPTYCTSSFRSYIAKRSRNRTSRVEVGKNVAKRFRE